LFKKIGGKNLEKTLKKRGWMKNDEKKLKKDYPQNSHLGLLLLDPY
jgi:hypothetical protein